MRFTVQKKKDAIVSASRIHNSCMLSLVKVFGIGLCIGIANVVPGVSGGTIAVVCNVYDKLVALSSLDFKRIRREWETLLSLGLGIGAGILLFARLMSIVYAAYPVQTSFFFIGIIIGSVPFLYQRVRSALHRTVVSSKTEPVMSFLCAALGLALMLCLFFYKTRGVYAASVLEALSVGATVRLAVMGALAAAAMLLPGISGSFVLVLLGMYQTVLQAVASFNMHVLLPFGLGVLAGLIGSARLISLLLERFPAPLYGFILGLVAGSLPYLYPASCQPFPMRILSAVALFAGYSTVTFFSGRDSSAQA